MLARALRRSPADHSLTNIYPLSSIFLVDFFEVFVGPEL
jgi:hypothetical protein